MCHEWTAVSPFNGRVCGGISAPIGGDYLAPHSPVCTITRPPRRCWSYAMRLCVQNSLTEYYVFRTPLVVRTNTLVTTIQSRLLFPSLVSLASDPYVKFCAVGYICRLFLNLWVAKQTQAAQTCQIPPPIYPGRSNLGLGLIADHEHVCRCRS